MVHKRFRRAAGTAGVLAATPAKNDRRRARRSMQGLRGVHNFAGPVLLFACGFLATPFRSNLSLDAHGLRRNLAHHASKASGDMTIVVRGGPGELFTMDADEQRAMAPATVSGSAGRLPVAIGAGGGFHYFREVAALGRLGPIVYTRGKEADWPAVLKRLAEIPNVIGFRYPTGGTSIRRALGSLSEEGLSWVAQGETRELEALGQAGGPVHPPGTNVAPEHRAAIAGIARKHAEA